VLPEFLFEDTAQEDVERNEVIVLGSNTAKATEVIKRTFKPNVTGFIEIRPVEAELVKLVGNTFAATKISFANEMWRIANSLSSTDPAMVLSVFRQVSPWMGPDMGLEGGWPYGGHCLPKDTRGLKKWTEETTGGAPPQLKGTIRENELMRRSDHDSADVNTGTAESVHTDN
jgi:UDP-glucose 6-dehydrogenase